MNGKKMMFYTKDLRGERITVICNENMSVKGTLKELFESNDNLVVEDYIVLEKQRLFGKGNMIEEKIVEIDKGNLIVIRGDAWRFMKV